MEGLKFLTNKGYIAFNFQLLKSYCICNSPESEKSCTLRKWMHKMKKLELRSSERSENQKHPGQLYHKISKF